jgi:L-2-hydroxyglutarate oxidase
VAWNIVTVIIAGGGIVGLATGYHLTSRGHEVIILEKELEVAAHQSGRNSGVIHAGIYYQRGSLKARYSREGRSMLEKFCARENVPFHRCGKVIVAVDEKELPQLHELQIRGEANGIDCRLISREELREIEPHARGVLAIHSPETGVVDYKIVCQRLRQIIERRGATVRLGEAICDVCIQDHGVRITSTKGEYRSDYVINCAGLYSDKVAKLTGFEPEIQIIPFRGEYYRLRPEAEHLCNGLIYPVPDLTFPFLGVHFTRMIGGGVICGPNAVLAFAREGYRKTQCDLLELGETLRFPGMRKLTAKYWRTGLGELLKSICKGAFVSGLQRLVPETKSSDLIPAIAGIRAQAVTRSGDLCDDFIVQRNERVINILNAPSPAATASLRIGQHIADLLP